VHGESLVSGNVVAMRAGVAEEDGALVGLYWAIVRLG